MGLELSMRRGGTAAARIKDWAADRFGAGEEAWLVTETICAAPGQPARQTVILMLHPAATITFRIGKAMTEIEQLDIDALGDTAAQLAAEGCC